MLGAAWWAVLAGCSGAAEDDEATSDASDESGGSGGSATEEAAVDADAAGDGNAVTDEDAAGGGSALAVDAVAVVRAREVVRTGSVDLAVDDAARAADTIRDAVAAAGGFVADEQVRDGSTEVDLTVRVPADELDAVRDEVAEAGEVVEQDVEARDVTAEVVDVETRVASLRASVERLQELLARAGDVGQLATVEGELTRRESELEALLGQQRVLEDQVALGTLTVRLSEDEAPVPDDDAAGFGDGLRRGWIVAVDGGRFALAAVGFLLPLAVPAGLVAALVVAGRRRLRRSRRLAGGQPVS